MNFLDLVFAVFWLVPVLLQIAGVFLTRLHFRSTPNSADTPYNLIPVSILKPLKGVDEGLEENLRSFFELDYPEFEIIFSIASPKDPARAFVERLFREYPHVRSRLILGETKVGLNPKINNLVSSYDEALHHWILISDSNVRVEKRYLKNLVSQIDNDTGMITSVVLGVEPQGWGGHLEAMYLNTFYAKGMVLASKANQDCVVGKSMLFRKSSADRFGGLRALGNYLAEDYMAGEAMKHLGLKVATAWHLVPQHVGKATFSSFWKRHIRWGRIRKSQAPLAFTGEALSSCFFSALVGAAIVPGIIQMNTGLFFALHVGLWMVLDLVVLLSVRAQVTYRTPLHWIVREALALPMWIHVFMGNTIEWRGARYRLGSGGLLTQALESRA